MALPDKALFPAVFRFNGEANLPGFRGDPERNIDLTSCSEKRIRRLKQAVIYICKGLNNPMALE
jgi:hypothetical protein